MALVTNHLRLAKELGTSELLKPTLTKAVVQKTLLGGGGGGTTFKHFSDISRK